jgi:deoxyadenosine/deoxycytidine kinase
VGKTSFVPLLASALPNAGYSLENVQENPYLACLYKDMKAWSFHSRVAFLAMKARVSQEVRSDYSWLIVDRPINELIVFARFHRDSGFLSERDFEVFVSLYTTLTRLLPVPDFIIHLCCSPEESLRRIRERGREFERGIDLSYLVQVRRYYDEWLREIKSERVIEVNTEDLSKMREAAAVIAQRVQL